MSYRRELNSLGDNKVLTKKRGKRWYYYSYFAV
jgi:hypothetical protein